MKQLTLPLLLSHAKGRERERGRDGDGPASTAAGSFAAWYSTGMHRGTHQPQGRRRTADATTPPLALNPTVVGPCTGDPKGGRRGSQGRGEGEVWAATTRAPKP